MISAFNAIGAPPPATAVANSKGARGSGNGTTTATTIPHGQVSVDVLNASSDSGVAHLVAAVLDTQGFTINEIGDASTPLSGTSSEILYGPSGAAAAATLATQLRGPVTSVADPNLSGQTIQLLVAGTSLSVSTSTSSSGSSNSGSTGAGTTTTTTSVVATGPTTTTTTTIPSDVYTNTEPEPWNPFPCTLGATTQAAPKTPTTLKAKGKKG